MTHHLTRFHTTNTHIHLPLPSLPSLQSPIALVAFVAATLLSPSPPPLLPHQPSPLPPPPLSPSPRHRQSNLFSTPPLCHPLHAHIITPCRCLVIGCSLASHCMPLPLPSPVGCCLSILSADGGSGAIICPFYSVDLSNSPSSSLEKCVAKAVELRPPRRLSVRSRAASFDHPLCQAYVQWGNAPGGWESMHAFIRRDFHCVGHGSGEFFL